MTTQPTPGDEQQVIKTLEYCLARLEHGPDANPNDGLIQDVRAAIQYLKSQPSGRDKIIFEVQDKEGNKHAVYGDDFAASALLDIIHKLNALEAKHEQRN